MYNGLHKIFSAVHVLRLSNRTHTQFFRFYNGYSVWNDMNTAVGEKDAIFVFLQMLERDRKLLEAQVKDLQVICQSKMCLYIKVPILKVT